MTEEEEKIEPTLTGMPIEVHIRRHSQFLIILTFCLLLGWYTFALFLIAWITGARWADNEGYLERNNMGHRYYYYFEQGLDAEAYTFTFTAEDEEGNNAIRKTSVSIV